LRSQKGILVGENVLGSPESIGNMLYCSSMLERKTYEMYNELSQKFNHPTIKPRLVTIAQDSFKHCNLLQEISKELIRKPPTERQCKRSLGETWNHIDEITKFLKERESISEQDFFEIINRLAFIEHHIGEEYSTLEKLKMLSYMSKEITEKYEIDVNSRKDVLNTIINDEKQHANFLFEIYEILKKKSKKPDSHPEFKYQNPDAWLTPSHTQKTGHVIG